MELDLLKLINDNPDITQRKIAQNLNISLGKVNTLIKENKNKDYIRLNIVGNRTKYTLSEVGLAKLKILLKEQKEKRLHIPVVGNKEIKEAVILAAGDNQYFNKPPGFLEIEKFSVIERIIEQLRNNGIEKIVIVTGYQEHYYDVYSKDKPYIFCLSNRNYKWTGSMYSLSLAQEYITGDFILVENDMVFENRAIEELVKIENRDCILLASESGSGDEAFVELKEGFLYKMSKDIHQFNRVDGEMIGISKISYNLFKLMLKEFSNNKNPYVNYEYIMLDIAQNYKVGYLKMNDLIWSEIDNEKQYNHVKNYIYPILKRKEQDYQQEKIKFEVEKALVIPRSKIQEIVQIGGMTNKNYKVVVEDTAYVLRIAGAGTEEMIDRQIEMINSELAAEYKIDAEIIYFNEKTGVKISKMILEAETLNPETAKRKKNIDSVAGILKQLHNSNMPMQNKFDVFSKIESYERLAIKTGGHLYSDYSEVKKKVLNLEQKLKEFGFALMPSHNDTVAENFIKDSDGKMYLIDWEYSGLNDNMWDLAAYALENNLSQAEEDILQNIYFGRDAYKIEKIRVIIHKICQDFLWSIWTVVKEAQGDEFGTYGMDRYNRCKKNLEVLENMISSK